MNTNQIHCLSFVAIALVTLFGGGSATAQQPSGVGATMPWTEYEAESGVLGGGATVVSMELPFYTSSGSLNNAEPVLEASGGAYVSLAATGQSVTWTNNTGQSITALNVRISIPDAPTGGGITSTIDLYVNGTLRQAISVDSMQTWVYGSNKEKDPADGSPEAEWDEYRFFVTGAAIANGSTIMLKKDAANTASFYNIDLIDLETPPAALTQPANSLSITSYGAVANSPSTDCTTAILNCINAAQSLGESVWIPSGTFYASTVRSGIGYGGYIATNITIQGAGMWYSKIYCNPTTNNSGTGALFGTLYSCKLENFAIDSNATWSQNALASMGPSGYNWLIDHIWVEHMSLGVWGGGSNGVISNVRITGTWSDGININNNSYSPFASNITVTNNFVRGTWDDGIALNGEDTPGSTTPMTGLTINNNTLDQTAGRIVDYCGRNVLIQNNYIHDVPGNNGITVGYWQQAGSVLNVLVQGNTILRCGGYGDASGIMVGTENTNYPDNNGNIQTYTDSGITVTRNIISDPYLGGADMHMCSGLDFENNVISNPQLFGIEIDGDAVGNGVFDNNVVGGMLAGEPVFMNSPDTFNVQTSATPLNVATEASSYNSENSVTTETCSEGGLDVTTTTAGSYTVYTNVNLNGVTSFAARVASASSGGTISVYLGSATGTLIGTCTVPVTGGAQVWTTELVNVSGASGYQNVYLVYTAGVKIEWFALEGQLTETQAASYDNESSVQTESSSEGGLDVGYISNGSYTEYNNVNMNGVTSFMARVASPSGGSTISIYLGSPTGTLVGTCSVPATGGYQTWENVSCTLTNGVSGYQNVYLVYTAGMNIECFDFQGIMNSTEAASYNAISGCAAQTTGSEGSGEENIGFITNGSYTEYTNVDMNNVTFFEARVASPSGGCTISIHEGSPTGTLIGTCSVPATGSYSTWTTVNCNLNGASGYQNVYLVYTAGMNVEWFAFQGTLPSVIPAADYNAISDCEAQTAGGESGWENIGYIANGSYTEYNSIDLTGMASFEARVASPSGGCTISVHLGSPTGTLIGTCSAPATGSYSTWMTATCNITPTTGTYNVYLVYTAGMNVEWFDFQP
jgi:hypothetical protein